MSERDYKNRKQLYHITSIANLRSILEKGLLPRKETRPTVDVADTEILTGRAQYGLDAMVPFHFFTNNPFDGRVQIDHPSESFVFIAVSREHAKENDWHISPKHPLNGEFDLLCYADGIEKIDWDTMNKRDYSTTEGKSVCMAECLSPTSVPVENFQQIFVKTAEDEKKVKTMLKELNLDVWVKVNSLMFTK